MSSQNFEKPITSPDDNYRIARKCIEFYNVVARLRAPDGCPWDREQTIASLKKYLIEEAYEAFAAAEQAVLSGRHLDYKNFCEELGDVLLQVFLNAHIAFENKLFSLEDVFAGIQEKMIRRHPHVFNRHASTAKTVDEVLTQWQEIKQREKQRDEKSVVDSGKDMSKEEPQTQKQQVGELFRKLKQKKFLPTLTYHFAVAKYAQKLGFSWLHLEDVVKDLEAEVRELKDEILASSPNTQRILDELGDVVYALCNVAAYVQDKVLSHKEEIDVDHAARLALDKFFKRMEMIELMFLEKGEKLTEDLARKLSFEEWNALWREAKKRLREARSD